MGLPENHVAKGISTDSARGPETTGTNRNNPDKRHTRRGRPAPPWNGPPSRVNDRYIRRSALPNIQPGDGAADEHALDFAGALEDGEDPGGTGSLRRSAAYGPRGISTVSARPVRDERRFRVGPCPVSVVVRTHAEKVLERLRGCCRQATPQRVHPRYIPSLGANFLPSTEPGRARLGQGARGPDARGMPTTPGLAAVAPTRRRHGADKPHPRRFGAPATGVRQAARSLLSAYGSRFAVTWQHAGL